jgi:hypothetical protein
MGHIIHAEGNRGPNFSIYSLGRDKSDTMVVNTTRVFNATFNNISIILWRSVLLVEETGVPGENHLSVTSH